MSESDEETPPALLVKFERLAALLLQRESMVRWAELPDAEEPEGADVKASTRFAFDLVLGLTKDQRTRIARILLEPPSRLALLHWIAAVGEENDLFNKETCAAVLAMMDVAAGTEAGVSHETILELLEKGLKDR